MSRPVRFYYALSAALGVVAFVFGMISKSGGANSFSVIIVLDILLLAVAFLAGRSAKVQQASPVKVGALVGAIYGLIVGIPTLFTTVTRSQVVHSYKGKVIPHTSITQVVNAANSPISHIFILSGSIVTRLLLGIISASVGAFMLRSKSSASVGKRSKNY